MKKEDIEIFIDGIENPAEPNQELKDAAERYIAEDNYNRYYNDFIEGAKWQQKKDIKELKPNPLLMDEVGHWDFRRQRSYSEEEVIAFGEFIFKHSLLTHTRGVKSLFEQFKKK